MFGLARVGRAFFGAPGHTPILATISFPLSGVAYSVSMTLAATTTDADLDAWQGVWEYSSDGGSTWSVAGTGAMVASGAISNFTFSLTSLTPGINYKVRVRARDRDRRVRGWVVSATFIVGPGFAGLYAQKNTTFYRAEDDRSSYRADWDVATFRAEKN